MSTQSERFAKNEVEGINRAFSGLEIEVVIDGKKHKVPVLVRALDRHPEPGQGIQFGGGNGLSLTIGDRTAHFSHEGRLIEAGKAPVERTQEQWHAVRDALPMQFAKYCRGEMTEEQLFAELKPAPKAPDNPQLGAVKNAK